MTGELAKLGFNQWFQDQVTPAMLSGYTIARVVAVHKDRYTITNGREYIPAEPVGKMLFSATSALDLPAVGDWVLVNCYDENTFSIIHEILPRRSLLKRKTPGKKIDFQLIAANIDTAFIVQSLDDNFNLRRLERYLVMIYESDINPVVLLSKSDLLTAEQVEEKKNAIKTIMPDLHVQAFSNMDSAGLMMVKELLEPAMTYCLIGSSGVGKTTLLNNIIGASLFKTKTIRQKDGKGRHATTHRHLIQLESGAMMIDTPGMRELGNFAVDTGLDETFSELTTLAVNCRFNDCTHTGEKGCRVLEAVENGQLSEERYRNFLKMKKESDFNAMSYREKRKKDKQFGKHVKSVLKHKKNLR